MDPLVLDARDLTVLILAGQYAPEMLAAHDRDPLDRYPAEEFAFDREDFIFNYLNRSSLTAHPRHTQNHVEIDQRSSNVPVDSAFAECLRTHFTQTNPAQTLREITQCINQTNQRLWTNPNPEAVRAQICFEPNLDNRLVPDTVPAAHLSRHNCLVTRDQNDPIQYEVSETPSHFSIPNLDNEGQRTLTTDLQAIRDESERALRADQDNRLPTEQQYQDWMHPSHAQNPLNVREANAHLFSERMQRRFNQDLQRDDTLSLFLDSIIQFYALRISEGLTYPHQPFNMTDPHHPLAVTAGPDESMEVYFTAGHNWPVRFQGNMTNNTWLARPADLAENSHARRWNFLGYDVAVATNGRIINSAMLGSLNYNRFDGDSLLALGGIGASVRIFSDHTHLRANVLAGSYLNSAQEQGDLILNGALELLVDSNQSLCSPLSLTAVSFLALPHTARCLNNGDYHPNYPSLNSVAKLGFLWNTRTQEVIPTFSISIEGTLRALGVRSRVAEFFGPLDLSLGLFAGFFPPSGR
ncbi:MAG: hypothetical protein HQM15_07875 [Deltaproteobacteria bacterium]|nr:hypothetical protein [Deltaproteobacteria bacterium]